MERVATLLRYMQFYSHVAHNLVKGDTFFQDHDFLGELYPAYEAAYDSVVERMIGLGMPCDLFKLHENACRMLSKVSYTDINRALSALLDGEKTLCKVIESEINPNPMSHPHGTLSQGTVQLIGELANQSEMRQYKIQQRLKNV